MEVIILVVSLLLATTDVILLSIRNDHLQQCNDWMYDYVRDTSDVCQSINDEYELMYDRYMKLVGDYGKLMSAYEKAYAMLEDNGLVSEVVE